MDVRTQLVERNCLRPSILARAQARTTRPAHKR